MSVSSAAMPKFESFELKNLQNPILPPPPENRVRPLDIGGNPPPQGDHPRSCAVKIKEVFLRVIQYVVDALKHTVAFLAHAVTTTENFQSICKFGKSLIEFFKYAFSIHNQGFGNLRNTLATGCDALDLAEFAIGTKEMFVGEKGVNGQRKYLWNDPEVSKWKLISKITGYAAKVLNVVQFLMNHGLLKLAQFSAFINSVPVLKVIADFSPLRLVKDTLGLISSSFGIADQAIGLDKSYQNKELQTLKLHKWEVKNALYTYLTETPEENIDNAKIDVLRNNYIVHRLAIEALKPADVAHIPQDLIEHKWDATVATYTDRQIINLNRVHCQTKIADKNANIDKNKVAITSGWLGVAFNVVKIVAIALGLAAVFALALSGPLFVAALTGLWLVTSTIGVVRLYYGFRQSQKAPALKVEADARLEERIAYREAIDHLHEDGNGLGLSGGPEVIVAA